MKIDPPSLVRAIQRSILPCGAVINPATLDFTVPSIPQPHLSSFFQLHQNQPTQNQIETFTELLGPTLVANICAFGLPNFNIPADKKVQVLYSASNLTVFYEQNLFFLSLFNDVIDSYVFTYDETLAGRDNGSGINAISQVSACVILYVTEFVHCIDYELPYIPPQMNQSTIGSSIEDLYKKWQDVFNATNGVFKDLSSRKDPTNSKAAFSKAIEIVRTANSAIIAKTTQLRADIFKFIEPLYPEKPLAKFQDYLYQLSNLSTSATFFSMLISMFDKEKGFIVAQVLNQLSKRVFTLSSKSTCLMRFRGKYDPVVAKIHQAAVEVGTIFKPLLVSLVSTVGTISEYIQNPLSQKLAALYSDMIRLTLRFEEEFTPCTLR